MIEFERKFRMDARGDLDWFFEKRIEETENFINLDEKTKTKSIYKFCKIEIFAQ